MPLTNDADKKDESTQANEDRIISGARGEGFFSGLARVVLFIVTILALLLFFVQCFGG